MVWGDPLSRYLAMTGVFGPPCLHLLKLLLREASELILKHEMKWIKLPLFFGVAGLFLFSAIPVSSSVLGVTEFGGIHT